MDYLITSEIEELQTEILDKTTQIEELQTSLKNKTKDLESLQESKSCHLWNINIYSVFIEVTSLQTTVVSKNEQVDELHSKLGKRNETVKELESLQERKSCAFQNYNGSSTFTL